MRFEGQVALVSGGSSGIGKATVIPMAGEGARVVAATRDQARSALVVRKTSARGGQASLVRRDAREMADCKAAVAHTADTWGRSGRHEKRPGPLAVRVKVSALRPVRFPARILFAFLSCR